MEDMPWFAPSYNIAPQSTQPVVRLNADTGKPEFALMRWGLVPYWAKDAKVGYTTINARAEEVAEKPLFREAVKRRRCLIPADAFYEWQKLSGKAEAAIRAGARRAANLTALQDCGNGGSRRMANRWRRSRF